MNISFSKEQRKHYVVWFTWLWLIFSLSAAIYFGFWLFPQVYLERNSSTVFIHFQAKQNSEDEATYYPNTSEFRRDYHQHLEDDTYFYFTACDLLPLSQKPFCDTRVNWKKLSLKDLNCSEVVNCYVEKYTLKEEQKAKYMDGIESLAGKNISIPSEIPLSWSDPSSWGDYTQLPLALICFYLALKLGRTLGEFIFVPYVSSEDLPSSKKESSSKKDQNSKN